MAREYILLGDYYFYVIFLLKAVSLRTRKIKDGRILSSYLGYYPDYCHEITMKVIRHESLDIYIYAKPKNQTELKYNQNLAERAEAIRCRRFESIINEQYDFFDKEKMKGDLLNPNGFLEASRPFRQTESIFHKTRLSVWLPLHTLHLP